MFDFEQRVFDYTHRRKLYESYENYTQARMKGMACFADYELARQRLAYLRYESIENLETNLITFEDNFTKNGGKVIWAENAQEACEAITQIIQQKEASKILKAKSALAEEIDLKTHLAKQNLYSKETDFGEFILQKLDDTPSHHITPAQHLSQTYISQHLYKKLPDLFNIEKKEALLQLQMFEEPKEFSQEDVIQAIGKHLRQEYLEAEIGIVEADFLVADIGGVAITENEGDANLLATFPKTHIIIASIDKLVSHFADLAIYWQMLSANSTGQRLASYNTLYTGAKQPTERDGSQEMYVVLLDNGRTKMLADAQLRNALRCIQCGACAHVCPVYRLVGGQAYQSPYMGAIGAVVNPHLYNSKPTYLEMSHASTLCGACEEVCPVQIDLPALLLHNRQMRTQANLASPTEKRMLKFWHKYMLNKKRWTRWNTKWKNNALQHFFKRTWGRRQALTEFVGESFHEQWTKNN